MSPLPNRPQQPPEAASSQPYAIDDAPPLNSPVMVQAMDADVPSSEGSLKLVRPIARPATPVEVPPSSPLEPAISTPSTVVESSTQELFPLHQRPIPAPSEPMQYRAIGLVRGAYQPSEEQFTQGSLTTQDGSVLQAVLLGRVMSLVKNHLNLEQEHLWVVYPRTREREKILHLQIVGVWEPENLTQSEPGDTEAQGEDAQREKEPGEEEQTSVPAVSYLPSSELPSDDFSIRGEIVYYSPENKQIAVKIQQKLRKKGEEQTKEFKLNLQGTLPGTKTMGYFWDLNVVRQGQDLVVQDGTLIAIVPPRKQPRRQFNRHKKPYAGKPQRSGGNFQKPNPARAPKPIKKRPLGEGVEQPVSGETSA
jgi:hypothetical protein